MAVSPVYHMRLAPDERLAWQLQAKSEGLSLAAWIKAACDAALDRSDGALGEPDQGMAQRAEGPIQASEASESHSETPPLGRRLSEDASRWRDPSGSASVPSFVPTSPVRLGKRSYEPDPR